MSYTNIRFRFTAEFTKPPSSKMKSLICFSLIAIVAVQAFTEQQKEKLNIQGKECRQQTGVSQEIINKGRNGEIIDDQKYKAYILCFAKKLGLATESGDINVASLRAQVKKAAEDEEETNKLMQKCVVQTGSPEDNFFQTFKCLYKDKPNFSPVD